MGKRLRKYNCTIIGLKELRENMATYVREVDKGRSFTVVRKSRPIFKVVPVDEWGDDGKWTTLLDFSKQGGIEVRKLLAMMRKVDEQEREISQKSRKKRAARNLQSSRENR
jgi:prevent-host-death family protein